MGYSPEFLRGILTLIGLAALVGIAAGAANELFGLGLFEAGYPGDTGYGSFALKLGGVLAVSVALSVLVERFGR